MTTDLSYRSVVLTKRKYVMSWELEHVVKEP